MMCVFIFSTIPCKYMKGYLRQIFSLLLVHYLIPDTNQNITSGNRP